MPAPRSLRTRLVSPRPGARVRLACHLGVRLHLMAVVLLAAGCSSNTASPPVADSPAWMESPASSAGSPSSPATLTVYFTDRHRYEAAVEPYEVPVTRQATGGVGPRAVLDAFFAGPTDAERAAGLMAVTSGFTGVRSLVVENGVAHVALDGRCASGGATYTIAGAVRANLLPFAEIAWVKIYDASGATGNPAGQTDSIPLCLEP